MSHRKFLVLISLMALLAIMAAACAPIPAAGDLPTPTQPPANTPTAPVVPPTSVPQPASPPQATLTDQDAGKAITLKVGDTLLVSLEGNITTGYTWEMVAADTAILAQQGDAAYAPESNLVGAPGLIRLTFKATAAGHQALNLVYHRPWEKDVKPLKTIAFDVTVVPAGGAQVNLTDQDAGNATTLKVGDTLVVSLAGNPTTGYNWEVSPVQGAILVQVGEPDFTPDNAMPGSGGAIRLTFQATVAGHQSLQFIYHRPWEKDVAPIKVLTFEVTVTSEGGTAPVQPASTPDTRPTPTTVVFPATGMKGWKTYTSADYGFSLSYPPDWTLELAKGTMVGHGILLHTADDSTLMNVSFKRATEDAFIGRTGVGAGDLVSRGKVMFAGAEVQRQVLVFQGKDFTVLYTYPGSMNRGDLVFDIGLDYWGTQTGAAGLTPEVEAQADLVVSSINLTK